MNLSGESVRSLVDYYNIDLKKLLIIHDEVDLPFASIKYQYQRGHGGHKGIRSTHQHLRTNEYNRLRAGVGRPENNQMEVANYVLQKFSDEELKELPNFLSHIGESVIYFIENGFSSTANHYNQNDRKRKRSELMGLQCGIVGLPNVGKSTLFNALTQAQVESANYPFCTIDPNVGVVEVPDKRLKKISEIVKPQKQIPTSMEFVDIAGLVAGASKGEGLGNQFLAHIRETQAIIHVCEMF